MQHNVMPGARFVDPTVLARIGNLDLLARTVVNGFINGLHRAPYFGASIDFAEHRGYVPGDDIRRVDWRLYARTDRYYVKQYEADTNTNFSVLLDVSRSMGFKSRTVSKLEYGCYLAACLVYLAHRQRDRVGIITFDQETVDHVPPSAKHFNVVLHTLDRAKAGRPGNLQVLGQLAEHFKRRSIVALISDFYEDPDTVLEAIKPLRFLGNDLMVFHVLDPAEIDFPYEEASAFEDLESGEQIPVVPESLGDQYRALMREHIAALGTKFSEHRIDYALLNSGEPLDRALFSYLSSRERMMRVQMSFLAPAFLLGLAALAVPVLVHLIQRERRRVVEFPSLMFLRRIPYQSVRRRRIRHWFLLLMRLAAVLMIVAAFARPFFRQGALAAGAAGGARDVVVLLDTSASMGYGDHWDRARAAARQAIDALSGDDRATLVLFASNAEENVRATPDRARLKAAVDAARVGSGATRYGPALKLAQSILSRSTRPRREAVLISDFQKSGWNGTEDVHFSEGTALTPVSVAAADVSNVAVPSVALARAAFSGQERLTVTAGVTNRASTAVTDLPVTLDIDGRVIQTEHVTIAANASASVAFAPFTLADANVKGIVRAGSDQLPQDNAFYFVLTPGRPVAVLLTDSRDQRGARSDPSLYLSKALAIGTTPPFQVDIVPAAQITLAQLEKHAVVVLNDVLFPGAVSNGVLNRFVERGGGLLAVLGEHSSWPASEAAMLPGTLGGAVDPPGARSGSLGFLNYSHPVFEVFKAPRSGDFSGTRIFRYRSLEVGAAAPDARVLARFDDGAVAAAEKRIGAGRVIAWTSSLDDSWNDLALKPVFLPLVHQMLRYLARYEEPAAWRTVGQALDVAERSPGQGDRLALTPSGERIALSGAGAPRFIELGTQGFYEVRSTASRAARPDTVAVNLDPAESDLSALDPRELIAAATGRAAPEPTAAAAAGASTVPPQDSERRQAIWWYLLFGGILILAGETILSNRLTRRTSGV